MNYCRKLACWICVFFLINGLHCWCPSWKKWFWIGLFSFIFWCFRLNSAANRLKSRAISTLGGVQRGRVRSFNMVSDQKIAKMMELTYQDCTEAKIKWAVNCYNSWRKMRLDRGVCDLEIVNTDLSEPLLLTKTNFEYSMCRFICEVKKSKTEGDYPGRTLYEMTCCIQSYLKKKGFNLGSWFTVMSFQNFKES